MNVPGWGWGKINGANPHGGPEMLLGAVQSLTGVQVDGYALLSLYAVRALTDAAGGVRVNVPLRMEYKDRAGNLNIDLQPDRVLIAVDPHLANAEHVARRLALAPKPPAAARPEMRVARSPRRRERFGVHMGDHQHLARGGVGHDGGH